MGWVRGRLIEVQLAFMLLSRLPAGTLSGKAPSLATSRWAFPLVGSIIGGIIALSYGGLSFVGLPPIIAALLALSLGLLATGALHEDGLADSADGMGGGHDRDRKLAIMKDSHIGSYGVLALIMVMGLRVFGLASLPPHFDMIALIITISILSRTIMVAYLCLLPSARDTGLGEMASGQTYKPLFFATALSLPMMAFCGVAILPSLIVMVIVAFGFALMAKRHIGGQTGDICGASQMLSETAGWLSLLVIL